MSDNGSGSGRQNVKRYETPELQGKGSWIEVRLCTIGENEAFIKESRRLAEAVGEAEANSEEEANLIAEVKSLGMDWYARYVIAWTWKDDDGQPLPLPSAQRDVVDKLTQPELEFVAAAISGSADAQKKLRKR